jgi:excisionase family DNA binding protein
MEQLLDIRQAATILNVSPFTLRGWTSRKLIKHVRLGRRVLFKKEDLEEMVSSNTVSPKWPRTVAK